MFGHSHYVPVLKAKAGELEAIRHTAESLRTEFTPILELMPVPLNWIDGQDDPVQAKSIEAHVERHASDIANAMGTDHPFFVDGKYIEEEDVLQDGREPIGAILSGLASAGAKPIPVIGINRIQEYVEACRAFSFSSEGDLCLRLESHDLENPAQLEGQINDLLDFVELPAHRMHCAVDFGSITPAVAGSLKVALPYQIAALPRLAEWRTLTLIASSFPSDLANVAQHSLETFARAEWDVWLQLRKDRQRLKRMPTFGDYTITHPELVILDPRKMRVAPKIKYTHVLEWVVAKGEAFRRKQDDKPNIPASVQYPKLSKSIMAHSAWKGRDFSWGDAFIADCADEKVTGRPQDWVSVGTVHHIAAVVQQLANLPAT